MSLSPGTRLGPYEIRRWLGAGGMGEVYAAWDARLEREVAVKVLPERVATDEVALARFEREARAVAALAHPNIVAIHDLGRDGDRAYAAMELLEGESLRERLRHGALPPRKAIAFARQVARGLGAAHDRGIVHRDLKPENVFLTRDGQAKILDFGLAVGSGEGESGSDAADPTRTSLTAPGAVLGTVGYMAPEQVRGETADHRADLFAFGCVLYEMLAGRRAFERDTAAETMTAILREEPPPIERASADIPPTLERVVERCLEKNRDERFQSARDLAFAIDTSGSNSGVDAVARASGARPRAGSWRTWALAGVALALGVAVGFGVAGVVRRPPAIEPVRVRTLTTSGFDSAPTPSPDGKLVAFVSSRDGIPRIWIRQIAGGGEQPLTDGPDVSPSFSPDGETLLFLRDEGGTTSAFRQALVGGRPKKLVDDVMEADWSPDGSRIAYARLETRDATKVTEIGIADAGTGHAEVLVRLPAQVAWIRFAPDGRSILGVEASVVGNVPDTAIVRIGVPDGSIERLRPEPAGMPLSSPVFTAAGDLVVVVAGSLLGDQGDPVSRVVRFDPSRGETTTLFWASDLFPLQGLRTDFATLEILAPGSLVFDRQKVRSSIRIVDARGGVDGDAGAKAVTRGESRDRQPTFSPDGRRVLFASNRSGNLDLWTIDLVTGDLRQLTDDAAQDWDPAFSPDGSRILWSSDRSGNLEIWTADAGGSGATRVTDDGVDAENPCMTPDGEWVVYWSANPDKQGVWKVRADGSEAVRLYDGPAVTTDLSPDGRYASFVDIGEESLRNVVRVVDVEHGGLVPFRVDIPTPVRAGTIIVGRTRWMPDGKGLAYVGIDDAGRTGVYVQDFDPRVVDTSATRRRLAGFSPDYVSESFGIAPDGRTVAIGAVETSRQLMLAEGVPGVAPPR